jgi:hypothetical protein
LASPLDYPDYPFSQDDIKSELLFMDAPGEVRRVGVMVTLDSLTWRDTVVSYARHKEKVRECLEAFDNLLAQGMLEPWAALHALDAYGCADLMVGKEMVRPNKVVH